MSTQLLTQSEAGQILRMTPSRVAKLAKAGEIPCVELPGGEVRFVEADLWSWIDTHKRPGSGMEVQQ